ncbi:hypothetical protein CDL15_Pgr015002 [Punica granatum]|uniref:Uncharacterized protein n=1 Tax=Punica granatum TaxID=22663 RepID=A0A218WZT1_PUNGR|nr:hypothetical protein CDL15_Pgr015002 [Punica granatum]
MDACSHCGAIKCCISHGPEHSYYRPTMPFNELLIMGSKALPTWRVLWRKIKGKMKKRTPRWSSASFRVAYDPFTYAQNFDQGCTLADPDILSRSFSARFAVPSRIFEQTAVVS